MTAARRAQWEVTIDRDGTSDSQVEDAKFWLRLPPSERAFRTWELSKEVYALAELNGGAFDEDLGAKMSCGDLSERRLPRSAFRITRR